VKRESLSRVKQRAVRISTVAFRSYSPGTSSPGTGYPPVAPSPYGSGAASTYSDQSPSSFVPRPYRPIGAPVPPPTQKLSEQPADYIVA